MVSRAARKSEAATERGYLKDAAALLLSHDRYRSAGHVDDTIEVGVHHCLESLRAQLLERCDIAVARVVHYDIEMPEGVDCHPHGSMSCVLLGHVQRHGANVIAILLNEVFELARIAGRRDQAVARCEHSLRDVAAQSACTAGHQPDFRHESPLR